MKVEKIAKTYIFPLILALFPLLHAGRGVELTDSGYSLAHYVFFPVIEAGFILNTYLAHVAGFLLTKLPFGHLMLGMNVYTSLLVSATALMAYRFFATKMPAWAAFAGVMAAIGLCWCPSVVLYNYLTYFLFLLAAILVFRGLAGPYPSCLVAAGVCLGLNFFVRNPNITQTALILCVWYYGRLRRKEMREVVRETILCIAGYMAAVLAVSAVMMVQYGPRAPLEMVANIFSISASSGLYTAGGMLRLIIDAYLVGMKWLLYMVLCIIAGIPFMMLKAGHLFRGKVSEERITVVKKIAYSLAIPVLFYGLWRIGMYGFDYRQKDSALQWAVVFLILSLFNMAWMLYSDKVDCQWKLIAAIGIVIVIVTPLGSNNYTWPIINNLFFIAPVTIWRTWRFARYGRRHAAYLSDSEQTPVPLFPMKAMQLAIVIIFVVQSLGVGVFYVYRDGELGGARDRAVVGIPVLAGMKTTAANAASLGALHNFLRLHPVWEGRDLILYGDIPALSYYLQRPSAIPHTWPDLDSYAAASFSHDLKDVARRMRDGEPAPLVICNAAMPPHRAASAKKPILDDFLRTEGYGEVFKNAQYVAYARE